LDTEKTSIPHMQSIITVKNIDYDRLKVADVSLKTAFAQAVQQGVAPNGVDASSVALDISKDDTQPTAVKVVARIPASKDVSVSTLPSGAVQAAVRAVANIALVVPQGANGVQRIMVYATSLKRAAVRESFERSMPVTFRIGPLEILSTSFSGPDGATGTTATDRDNNQVLIDSFESQAGDILQADGVHQGTLVWEVEERNAPVVILSTRLPALDNTKSASEIEDIWNAKMMKIRSQVQQQFLDADVDQVLPKKVCADDFEISFSAQRVETTLTSLDLDMVIHGVDYKSIISEKKLLFQSTFAEAIRRGIELYDDAASNELTADMRDSIAVSISAGSQLNTVDVTASIPTQPFYAPPVGTATAVVDTIRTKLEAQIEDAAETDLVTSLQTELRNIRGVEYVSTWLASSITVTFPGQAESV